MKVKKALVFELNLPRRKTLESSKLLHKKQIG